MSDREARKKERKVANRNLKRGMVHAEPVRTGKSKEVKQIDRVIREAQEEAPIAPVPKRYGGRYLVAGLPKPRIRKRKSK